MSRGMRRKEPAKVCLTFHSRSCSVKSPQIQEKGSLQEASSSALPFPDEACEVMSVDALIHSLHQCQEKGDIRHGNHVHTHICSAGLESHVAVSNLLIRMFVACGNALDAEKLFSQSTNPSVDAWTSLILGYSQCGQLQHALYLYEKMQIVGVPPSNYTFVFLLKGCASMKNLEMGRLVHLKGKQKGFANDLIVCSTLVDMYAKCGSFPDAREAVNGMPIPDVVAWNALLSGYVEHDLGQDALGCFEQMNAEGVASNNITLVCILRACCMMCAIAKGHEIHAEIIQKGFEREVFTGNTLVDMYAKLGFIKEAHEVLSKMVARDCVSWNALIAGYAEQGPFEEALNCFRRMQCEHISPDAVTFLCTLKACGNMGSLDKGQSTHAEITQKGFERYLLIGGSVVDMYAKCGSVSQAHEVFLKLPQKSAVSWNALLRGYAELGPFREAMVCFERMQAEDISPDATNFASILKVCSSMLANDKGQEIHTLIVERGIDGNLFVGNSLVDMYAKCGMLADAQIVLDKQEIQNVVAWTALIVGYIENGCYHEALVSFEKMLVKGCVADATVLGCGLKACSCTGAIVKGQELHSEIVKKDLERELLVGSALLDMYIKCGLLGEAHKVFDKLSLDDVVSWSALIKGYGMNHKGGIAVQFFEDMQKRGVKPDAIAFTCLLSACGRSSLVAEGWKLFKMMKEEYGILPQMEHFTCMVDLLARSGHVHEAVKLSQAMPVSPSEDMWMSLLGSCKIFAKTNLGQSCFQHLFNLSLKLDAPYVLMADIFSRIEKLDGAQTLENLRMGTAAEVI